MRILFVTTCYPNKNSPQYCIFLEQQAIALSKLSNSVDVLYIDESGNKREEFLQNGIKVIKLPIKAATKFESLVFSTFSNEETKEAEKIISGNYDVVSLHFGGKKVTRSIEKICKNAKIPFVLHFHGLNVWYEAYEKFKLLYDWYRVQNRIIYKKADAVVGVSDKVVGRFKEKINTVPAYTVYNGVDIDRFKYRNITKLKKPLQLLCVANLIDLKGQDLLIKALDKLNNKNIDCKLTIVGGGSNEQYLKDLVKTLNLSDKIIFTGVLDYQSVADLMSENDIFIMPSYYEALGCVYLEAMSCGMITVGVISQGIDEIIKPNENGFLILPKDVNSIVNTLIEIQELSMEELSIISKSAKETADNYTWENSAKALNEVYEKTVSRFRKDKN